MSAHTPGPWKLHGRFSVVSGDPENDPISGGVGPNAGYFIATVEPDYAHPRNAFKAPCAAADANARLIVAAPEMFRLLNGVSLTIDAALASGKPIDSKRLIKLGTEIDAIIAKVKGRS